MGWNDLLTPQTIGALVLALAGVPFALSKLVSQWKADGVGRRASDAQVSLISTLQNERAEWKKLYEETHNLLEAQRQTNNLLRIQNAMMRQMLASRGMTPEELATIDLMIHDAREIQ